MDTEPTYWGGPEDECLSCSDEAECIHHQAEQRLPLGPDEIITVVGYARNEVGDCVIDSNALHVLESVLDNLDEDFGSPDCCTEPTEEMRALATKFVSDLVKLYPVWRCKPIVTKEVNLRDWCAENAPELLEGE